MFYILNHKEVAYTYIGICRCAVRMTRILQFQIPFVPLPYSRSGRYFSAGGRRYQTEKRMINEELVFYGCGTIYSTVQRWIRPPYHTVVTLFPNQGVSRGFHAINHAQGKFLNIAIPPVA
ncbi:hypothetical protein PUN28_014505 [Cardiocondyla obscurior]|uniref:Uncharacterized protein n=1 Tax=Cardiocondyla obscurior TaxID=286306 RepID=A0AAW2F3T0_9HYME